MNAFSANPELLEHLVDGVLVVDAEGIVQYANQAAKEMFSGFEAPLVGFHFGISVSPDSRAATVQLPGDGPPRHIELRTNQFEQEEDFVSVVSLRDVTEERTLNERNRELSRIVESSDDAIIGLDLDGTITSWNPGAEKMYGYTPGKAMGRNVQMLNPPDESDDFSHILDKIKRGESVFQNETVRVTRDGRRLNVSLTVSPVRNEEGRIVGLAKIARDISTQVESRHRIEHLNRILRAIREVNRLIVKQRDPDKLIGETCDIIVNESCFEAAWILLTNEHNEIVQSGHAGLNDKTADTFSAMVEKGKLQDCCRESMNRDEKDCVLDPLETDCTLAGLREGEDHYVTCLKNQGDCYGFLCVYSSKETKATAEDMALMDEIAGDLAMALRDIGLSREQERSVKKLRRQEELLNTTGEMARVGGWDINLEENTVNWTQATRQIHEVPEDYRPTVDQALDFYPDCRDQVAEALRCAREEGNPYDMKVPFTTAKNNPLWVRIMGEAEMENGVCVRLHGVIQDITEQRRAEQKKLEAMELARREGDLVRLIVEHGLVGFIMVNADGEITEANSQAENILGLEREDILGRDYKAQEWKITDENGNPFPQEDLPVARVLKTWESVRNVVHSIQWPSGKRRTLNVCAGPLFDQEGKLERVACTVEDITERKSMEAQLMQSQKMESIGQLAGGVAHDFNNLLMGVMGYAELSLEQLEKEHPARKWISDIIKETERSANLTRQLLAFARKQDVTPKVLDLNDEVEGILKMLRRLIGEDVELGWYPGSDTLRLKMDPGQIDQILANLCVNARDAIGGVGNVSIRTSAYETETPVSTTDGNLEPGSYVLLEVEDNGAGMDSETLEHIFEPFYTTKGVGEGTGLGLATVYGIVKQNGGGIDVQSRDKEGTTFKIYLCAHHGEVEKDQHNSDSASSLKGSETILLVEDEKAIRDTMSLCLSYMGYEVFKAEDPEHALRLIREDLKNIDLLITDVIMPGMNGRELAEQVLQEHPKVKVLYISGYTADIIADRGIVDDGFEFLHKPITRDALAGKVRDMLDA